MRAGEFRLPIKRSRVQIPSSTLTWQSGLLHPWRDRTKHQHSLTCPHHLKLNNDAGRRVSVTLVKYNFPVLTAMPASPNLRE